MRLALVTPGFSASEDDWCIPALWDLVRALTAHDDVTVFTLRYPHHRRPYEVHGARVIPLGGAVTRGPARLPLFLRALAEIRRRRPFDVIHAFWAHEPGFLATLAGRFLNTPAVVSLMGGELADLADIDYGGQRTVTNRFLVRHALARADAVIVGSESLRRLAEPHVASHRLHTLPFGVDTDRFRPGAVEDSDDVAIVLDGDPKLLHVASLCPVKDQATLLDAFATVTQRLPGARLHLVGEGELRGALEHRTRELGLDERVRFHGALPHDALSGVYRQADLCVLSSRFESLAMVVLEAVACGRATVGTAVGILPELGPTVAPADPAALAELLVRTLDDPPAIAVRERHGLAASVARLRELYRTLAGTDVVS